jgi:hypothetical protein
MFDLSQTRFPSTLTQPLSTLNIDNSLSTDLEAVKTAQNMPPEPRKEAFIGGCPQGWKKRWKTNGSTFRYLRRVSN